MTMLKQNTETIRTDNFLKINQMDGQQTIWSTTGRRRTLYRSPTTWTSQGEILTTFAAFRIKKTFAADEV